MAESHNVDIGSGWGLWGDLELRGAGFPADWLLRLHDPGLVTSVDEVVAAERDVEAARAAIRDAAQKRLEATPPDQRRSLARALDRFGRTGRAAFGPEHGDFAALLSALEASEAALAALQREAALRHAAAETSAAGMLREIAAEPRFREAVCWQNRGALRVFDAFLARAPAPATSAARQKERLIASYLQRYCAKNDRIGFFGPSAWGAISDRGESFVFAPGRSLLARRVTRLEAWAIDALADGLARDPELRAELAPRRMPTMQLDGRTLHQPTGRTSDLPVEYAALLAACDGRTSARRIAGALVADPSLALAGEDEVLAMLEELADKGLVVWTVDTPTTGGRPEALLRGELERLASGPARDRALAALAELERARDEVAEAAGSPARLSVAFDRLDQTFASLTGVDPVRHPGQTYAARTIAFEQCKRDVQLEVGPAVCQRLAPPLRLLLRSARWFTHEIARRYRRSLGALYRRLCDQQGTRIIGYQRFAAELHPLFPGAGHPDSIVGQVRAELRSRWWNLFGLHEEDREVSLSAGALEDAVDQAFAAPGPGWPSARHHSVDVMIAAGDAAAVARGDGFFVLGEIHPGMNALLIPDLPHPYPDDTVLFDRRDQDVGVPCIAPVWSRARTHVDYYSRSRRDLDVENGPARSWRPRDQVLAAADLVVEEIDRSLLVRTLDGRHRFDVIAFLERHLIAESYQQFGLTAARPHVPRVLIDSVVVFRERWSLTPSEIDFAPAASPIERFCRARAWTRRLGIPRFVFVRTPEETKPMYVDFESPVYVDVAAKMIRGASAVEIVEMVPSFGELWLADAPGSRYTSELRLAAVDPRAWTAEDVPDDP